MGSRGIVQVARLARERMTLRFKQLGTLQRHDVSLEDVERVFVRLTPRPDKQIIVDVVTSGHVFRCVEGKTLINYPTFLDEVAPGGLQNFRRFVGWLIEQQDESDPATTDFVSGEPPEAFASAEELIAYDAYLEGRESVMPRGSAGDAAAPASPATDEIEKVWAEHATQLRQEAATGTGVDPRLAGYVLVGLGGVIGFAGMLLLMALVANERLSSNPASTGLIGILALCAFIGIVLMLSGVIMVRKAQQLMGDS